MKNKPLYILAQEHSLGELEMMDKETLEWMKSKFGKIIINLPVVVSKYEPLEIEKFRKFIPEKDWFLRSKHINSIHGINHVIREMLYSLLVRTYLKLDIAIEDLLVAAAIHDLRRLNDNEDAGHGERAVEWFKKNNALFLVKNYSHKYIEYAVANHEVETVTLNLKSRLYKNQLLLALRMGDALDRYRQPKEKWWPNPKYLPVKISQKMLNFVKSFTYKTEVETLDKPSKDAVEIILRNAVDAGILTEKTKYWINEDLNFNWNSKIKRNQLNKISEIKEQEKVWKDYLISNTPMGSLFIKDSLFETVDMGKGLMVLHLTSNLKEIMKSKKILTSGGGLGSCIYGVPLRDNLKVHNLATFIYKTELPMFLKSQNKKINTEALVIKIPQKNFNNSNSIAKVNYLDWGNYYLKAFLKTGKGLLNRKVKAEMAENIKKYVFPFQNLVWLKDLSSEEFLSLFNEAIFNLPMLRVPYFETVLEFIFLFQNSKTAKKYKEKGELYNNDTKSLLFSLNPKLRERFSLTHFDVAVEQIAEEIKDAAFISNFSRGKFINFIKWRFSHNLRFHIMLSNVLTSDSFVFEDVLKKSPSLIGYILFRKFRGELNLELELSKILLKHYYDDKIKLLTYSNLPKGEVGVLPFVSDAKFYKAQVNNKNVILKRQLQIKIIGKLVDNSQVVMRSPESKMS